MIIEKSWNEFRDSGLLWWINMILHTFGWAIVYEMEKDEVLRVYPARVKFRGFDDKSDTKGYSQVSEYLKNNIDELLDEAKN